MSSGLALAMAMESAVGHGALRSRGSGAGSTERSCDATMRLHQAWKSPPSRPSSNAARASWRSVQGTTGSLSEGITACTNLTILTIHGSRRTKPGVFSGARLAAVCCSSARLPTPNNLPKLECCELPQDLSSKGNATSRASMHAPKIARPYAGEQVSR
jgi:hypothetical protein